MSVESVALKFTELCNQGKHFEVMRTMYSPDMVSVEGDGRETVGKEAVIRKSVMGMACSPSGSGFQRVDSDHCA